MDRFDKLQLWVTGGLRFFIFIFFIYELLKFHFFLAAVIFLVLLLTYLPAMVERNYNVVLPIELTFFYTIFIFLSIILGDLIQTYTALWWWDLFLHLFGGILLGMAGFTFIYLIMKYSKRTVMSKTVTILFTFCFANAMGLIWEYFEFVVTKLGWYTMQHGELDTMSDLLLVTVGSLFACYLGYLYLGEKHRFSLYTRLIRKAVNKSK